MAETRENSIPQAPVAAIPEVFPDCRETGHGRALSGGPRAPWDSRSGCRPRFRRGWARTRAAARQTRCAASLRQIGMALQTYVDDYDGRYPLERINEAITAMETGQALRNVIVF